VGSQCEDLIIVLLKGSLTLSEERRLRVFEDSVKGDWRNLRNEELNDLYSLPSSVRVVKSRRMRWAGHGEERGVHRALVGKSEGKKPMGRPRRRWDNNIRMDI
jgi:hypothetical protein